MQVVPNGFDLERFCPSESARKQLRQSLSLAPETPLIGLVARFSELKGQQLFVEAMAAVAAQSPETHFVLCGTHITPQNTKLRQWIEASGHAARFHLLGERLDVEQVHAALDIEVSASVSEAFSNSLGEALCCGVPCVVTDVGDSAWLVDDAGWSSLRRTELRWPSLPADSANASNAASSPQPARPQRMEQNFDIAVIARQYEEIWREVLAQQIQPVTRVKAA